MSRGRLLAAAVVYAGILALSSIPAQTGSGPGLAGPAWMSVVAHVVEYLVLGLALRWAAGPHRAWWALMLAGAVLAAGDEVYQELAVAGRRIQAVDLALDVIGLALGVWLLAVLRDRSTRWRGGVRVGSRPGPPGDRSDPFSFQAGAAGDGPTLRVSGPAWHGTAGEPPEVVPLSVLCPMPPGPLPR